MRLLLILRGFHPDTDPSAVGEYRWMPEHEAYVWEGRALEADEFNELFRTWLPRQANIRGIRALDVRAIPAAETTTQGSETVSRLAHNQETAGSTPAPASTAADLAAAADLLAKAKIATATPAPRSKKT